MARRRRRRRQSGGGFVELIMTLVIFGFPIWIIGQHAGFIPNIYATEQCNVKTPPLFVGLAIRAHWLLPWDYDSAVALAFTENRTYDPEATNTTNDDGSWDRGIFQISNTHQADRIAAFGYTYDDMLSIWPNVRVAKAIWLDNGRSFRRRWYGPNHCAIRPLP